ncbi:MAG: hypothetical protein A2499_16205 [Stygiobacter sp. RIFOXYC12_FULL_38_8]|nr:MAG: hypothetical protein A2X62_04830 [Stygiobacter sp. GWC2_38_9]OGV07046.1 MAG: hypothetical protein A2299_03675 [Stygiobacter sp. RIFOXYB2_FULL_37_11]OGV10731.1 MAG: hypothetical protein A2237_10480 [Stygiobacter sp. RIFOXYA2_FULL_38_8]OGV12439.1 MAG: hypothetical protein A2440_14380 [Stygiobacter sp. RIFOXYC2_FULL_38_25]OGV24068.1 MAG: hypothetical protein A2499_16205 [Stygiobacter sp. RIFOXYC12_FULL_38_8]OGV78702.1 MAG: hypothetical protein A2X65_08545 [Stygiobacter sp. GWF2_38_21]RJQ
MSVAQTIKTKKNLTDRNSKKTSKKNANKKKLRFFVESATAEEIRKSLSITDKQYAEIEKEMKKILPEKKAAQIRRLYAH